MRIELPPIESFTSRDVAVIGRVIRFPDIDPGGFLRYDRKP